MVNEPIPSPPNMQSISPKSRDPDQNLPDKKQAYNPFP